MAWGRVRLACGWTNSYIHTIHIHIYIPIYPYSHQCSSFPFASGAMHARLLRLDLEAFGFPVTALPPKLVGLILVFCSLELGVFAHGLGVLAIQHVREPLPHAQHIRVFALLEVVPRRQILESRHLEAF